MSLNRSVNKEIMAHCIIDYYLEFKSNGMINLECLIYILFVFQGRLSLCHFECPGTHSTEMDKFEIKDLHAHNSKR